MGAYGSDGANNVVNDAWTGLQWRRCEQGQAWRNCIDEPGETLGRAMNGHAFGLESWLVWAGAAELMQ